MIPDDFSPIKWLNEKVELIDQTLLPLEEKWITITNYTQIINAIKTMQIRGAPAIGIAGAYGLALGAIEVYKSKESKSLENFLKHLNFISLKLIDSRPTGSNLKWAIDRMMKIANKIEVSLMDDTTAIGRNKHAQTTIPYAAYDAVPPTKNDSFPLTKILFIISLSFHLA